MILPKDTEKTFYHMTSLIWDNKKITTLKLAVLCSGKAMMTCHGGLLLEFKKVIFVYLVKQCLKPLYIPSVMMPKTLFL